VFKIINMYVPYRDKKPFWEGDGDFNILNKDDVILRGDFNLAINQRDIWGVMARRDILAYLFSHFFEEQKLIDVEPVKIVLTWRNGGRGRSGIFKRPNNFFIANQLLSYSVGVKFWVG
jgi:hypothetical protein